MKQARKRGPVRLAGGWERWPDGELSKCDHIHEPFDEEETPAGPCLHVQLKVMRDGKDFAFEADLRDALRYGSRSLVVARGFAFTKENLAMDAAEKQAKRWRKQRA
jgi:hypothetical protein